MNARKQNLVKPQPVEVPMTIAGELKMMTSVGAAICRVEKCAVRIIVTSVVQPHSYLTQVHQTSLPGVEHHPLNPPSIIPTMYQS